MEKLLKQKRIYPSTKKIFDEKYDEAKNKKNIFPAGITDSEFRQLIIKELLGIDWYVVVPLGQNQINECALLGILKRYSPIKKQWKKEEL